MKKSIRRLTALLLAAVLLPALAACGTDREAALAEQVALTVNGHEITAGEYAANYLQKKATMEQVMYQYGVMADLWNSEAADSYKQTLDEYARDQSAALYLVAEQFEAAGLELTAEEAAAAKGAGSAQLKQMGFTPELTERLARYFLMVERLDAYYFGEGGVMSPEEPEIEDYFQQNYYRAKHILVSTRDENSLPITDEARLAELDKKAQDLYRRAAAGEDFDALIEAYGEDPGMGANPDGYLFTDGVMVAEFQNATAALAENEISPPVKTDFGWHIILRLPLRAEERAEVHSDIVTALTGMDMDKLLGQWIAQATIEEAPILSEITFDTVEEYKYHVE